MARTIPIFLRSTAHRLRYPFRIFPLPDRSARCGWGALTANSSQIRLIASANKARVDGRGYQDLRPITCEVGVLPRAHGSAMFQRGETQALALVTLAPIEEAQNIDAYGGGITSKRFILHYNFPPFSVGETGR